MICFGAVPLFIGWLVGLGAVVLSGAPARRAALVAILSDNCHSLVVVVVVAALLMTCQIYFF